MSEPVFDSPRKALAFALNYRLELPRPAMTQMVADGRLRAIELADGSKVVISSGGRSKPRSEQLVGLDGAATAGMVLQHLISLPEAQQLVLIAELAHPSLPCNCGRPCCAGSMPNPKWTRAVLKLCDHLRDEAELSKIPGKKGFSTGPNLRLALVERFFVPGRGLSIERLAERNDVSEQTVYAHQRPIVEYLEREADAGWQKIDQWLAEAGIVGDLSAVVV